MSILKKKNNPLKKFLKKYHLTSYLNRAVVLVDFNTKFATGSKVLRLGKMTLQPMVFHSIHIVIHSL